MKIDVSWSLLSEVWLVVLSFFINVLVMLILSVNKRDIVDNSLRKLL